MENRRSAIARSTRADSPSPRDFRRFRPAGFTLIEILVAVAVFATMAALAYGGLNALVRVRGELAAAQDALRTLTRAVALFDRDLRAAVARPVRDTNGHPLPAFIGAPGQAEFTRVGFANPQAEPRSNLERVQYRLDGETLQRISFGVLDRAPTTTPQVTMLRAATATLRLRYLDAQNRWSERWPAIDAANPLTDLPRAVEVRLDTRDYGEITRLIELTSAWPPPWPALPAAGRKP